MPWFPNPNGGAPIQAATNPNLAGGSYGLYSDPSYDGPPPSTGGAAAPATPGAPGTAPTVSNNAAIQQLGQQVNSLLGAIASGNKQAFDEAVRQFNVSFGLDKDKFTEAIRQFNENLTISQAGLTGTYQGAPTQQAQLQAANLATQQAGVTGYYQNPNLGSGNLAMDGFQTKASDSDRQTYLGAEGGNVQAAAEHWLRDVTGAVRNAVVGAGGQFTTDSLRSYVYGPQAASTPTMAREAQQFGQQLSAITTAAGLQANPFRQAQVIGQLGHILGGTPVAGFQAPGAAQGQTDFSGMGNMQRMIDDIRGGPGAINSQTTQGILDAIPTPTKVNSPDFYRSSPLTQNMVLQGMQEKYGLSPEDSLAQIRNTLPQFQAPTTFGGVKR